MGLVRSLYDEDFYAWTQTQATLLRQAKASDLDYENLAEELESLGISQWHALESRLDVVVRHLLKWRYQPGRRSRSWQRTIIEQRRRLRRLLRRSPSLRRHVLEMIAEEYASIRKQTALETHLSETTLPSACPWTADRVLDDDFWPQEDASEVS
jgi:hypothetical protein